VIENSGMARALVEQSNKLDALMRRLDIQLPEVLATYARGSWSVHFPSGFSIRFGVGYQVEGVRVSVGGTPRADDIDGVRVWVSDSQRALVLAELVIKMMEGEDE